MEACYGGTDVMERSCAVAREIDINITHFRIKPLALTNSHGRCMAVTPERTIASVGGCPLNI
jgi:hypothetical protein